MPFGVTWSNLIEQVDDLPSNATLVTPVSNKRFRISDVQEHRINIEFQDSGQSRPLKRDQFEALYTRIDESFDGFDLEKIPPGAEPYASVLSLHPRYEIDQNKGKILETDAPTSTQLVDTDEPDDDVDRTEPDLSVYSDALLLIDALERHDVTDLTELDTNVLVDLYTLLSDVQRSANDLRQEIADGLLERVHHDQPVPGQYGSVQRTSRRNRTLKDDDEVLTVLKDAGVDTERVMGVDREKVDDVLDVTTVPESAVYEIDESEYVRKADVDEDVKETRLQGLKDQLATSDDPDAQELREEIEELEDRIQELTEFQSGREFHTRSDAES